MSGSKNKYEFYTDCKSFLSSGKCDETEEQQCEFRHCEEALNSQVVCSKWLDSKCFDKKCPEEHSSSRTEKLQKKDGTSKQSKDEKKFDKNKKLIILDGIDPSCSRPLIKQFCKDVLETETAFQTFQYNKKAALVGFKDPQDHAALKKRMKENFEKCPDSCKNVQLKTTSYCKKVVLSNIPLDVTKEEIVNLLKENKVQTSDSAKLEFQTGGQYALVELKNLYQCMTVLKMKLLLKGQKIKVFRYNAGFKTAEVLEFERAKQIFNRPAVSRKANTSKEESKEVLINVPKNQEKSENMKSPDPEIRKYLPSFKKDTFMMLLKPTGIVQKIEEEFNVKISHDEDKSQIVLCGTPTACENAGKCLVQSMKDLLVDKIDVSDKIYSFMETELGREEVSELMLASNVFVVVRRAAAKNKLLVTCWKKDDAMSAQAVLLGNLDDEYFSNYPMNEKQLQTDIDNGDEIDDKCGEASDRGVENNGQDNEDKDKEDDDSGDYSLLFPVQADKKAFLTMFWNQTIQPIEKEFENSVQISVHKDNELMTIKGSKADAISSAEAKLEKIVNDIKVKQICLQQPSVVRLFSKESTRSFRSGVEKEFSVIIVDVKEDKASLCQGGGKDLHNGSNVELVVGDIATQKSDVIVNSTAPDLRLSRNSSSLALSRAAGPGLQLACDGLASSGSMLKDKVIKTPGFNLNCKEVYHVVVGNDITNIKRVITDVLFEASARGYESVSFPALGTGICAFDADTVANIFRSTIDEFFKICTVQTTLKQVYIVLFHKDSQAIAAFKKVFEHVNIYQNQGQMSYKKQLDVKTEKQPVPQTQDFGGWFYKVISAFFSSSRASADNSCGNNETESTRKNKSNDKNVTESKTKRSHSGVTLNIYGFNLADIDNALEKINTFVREYSTETTQELPLAGNLEISEKHEIKQYSLSCNVVADFDGKGNITLKGDAKDISCVTKYCTELFVKKTKKESFDELPESWSAMPVNWQGLQASYDCVPVNAGSSEYTKVVNKFHQTSKGWITDISVSRIQNPQLYRALMLKKRSMDKKGGKGSNEMQLFHGTSKDTCEEINHHGFNRSFAGKNATAYGKGSYFATESSYSTRYATRSHDGRKYMYLARVLVGEFTQGTPDMKAPPKKYLSSTEMYDSTVNNTYNPTIFVVYHDNQSYPEYLISFRSSSYSLY